MEVRAICGANTNFKVKKVVISPKIMEFYCDYLKCPHRGEKGCSCRVKEYPAMMMAVDGGFMWIVGSCVKEVK